MTAAVKEAKPANSWRIRPENPGDSAGIDALNAAAFGPGRFTKSAYRLREGVEPVAGLSFVAVEGAALRGSVRFWPVAIGGHPALLLGPLAVQSDQRGRGIGIALMTAGIGAAQMAGHEVMILIGDEPYYAKVGFSRLPPGRVKFPGPVDPARVLALSLQPGATLSLSGEVRRAKLDAAVSADGAGVA